MARPKRCSQAVESKRHRHAESKRPRQPTEGRPLEQLLSSVLPEAERLDAVATCLGHVRLLVRALYGEDAAVIVQGSYAQGLALRGSDLDVAVVVDANGEQESASGSDIVNRRRAVTCLSRLANELAAIQSEEIRIALKIFTARVPLLRLHFRVDTGKDADAQTTGRLVVDVSVGASLARGACDRCVHALLQRDSSGVAAALCRFVKLWAKRRGLTNTLRGGLSSFGFVLLVIFFLQRQQSDGALPKLAPAPPWQAARSIKASAQDTDCECPEIFGAPVGGAEERFAKLLATFFSWAAEKLPNYGDGALSVMTGKVEPRRKTRFVGPLVLQVPSAPEENAARCLRRDVWERRILPEFVRAGRIASRLLKRQGRKAASTAVRALFMSAARKEEEAEDPAAEAAEKEVVMEEDEALGSQASTRASEDEDSTANGPSPHRSGRAVARKRPATAHEEMCVGGAPKRRRKLGKARNGLCDAAAAKMLVQDKPRVQADVAAPLERWLGLRAMLNPAEAAGS